MKKSTKIFNTEVIERLALSDNIPPFDEQRKGTQVIMIEEGKKTVIYDDYSMYCDADARNGKTGRLGRGAAYHLCGCKHIPSLYGEYEVPFYGHGPQCGYGYL